MYLLGFLIYEENPNRKRSSSDFIFSDVQISLDAAELAATFTILSNSF